MAKKEKKQPRRPFTATRKYQSRVAKERRQMRYIRIGIIALGAIIVLIFGAGLAKTQVLDPAATRSAKEALKTTPAATVNGDMISITDWQARVRYERVLRINQIAQISQQLSMFDPSTDFGQQIINQGQAQIQEIQNLLDLADGIGADVLDQMVAEKLIRQEAARRGITVTPDELQKYIEVNFFAYPFPPTPEPVPTLPPPTASPTVTLTPSPTLTPTVPPTPRSREDFESSYQNYTQQIRDATGMSEEMWRSMIEGELYRQKLLDAFGADLETNVLHVKGSYIAAIDKETADGFLARLDAGESFDALMEEVQADTSEEPPATASSFDWSPLTELDNRFGPGFGKIVGNTEPGHYTTDEFVGFDGRYYITFVEGKEVRELSSSLQEQQRQDTLDAWLSDQKAQEGAVVYGDWRPYVPHDPSLQ
jgi:hypothetical protein